ncbi:MAG TPA: hypothetical protein VEK08_25775 [Planctomycetota bacterium]|nr:hypothetical protein [Planctomycetota bacterium]
MKPRWFQLHLSTCVVLMFVAGGLLWANLVERKQIDSDNRVWAHLGWPIWFTSTFKGGWISIGKPERWYEFHSTWLVFDVLIGLALLFTVATAIESYLRRREDRTP